MTQTCIEMEWDGPFGDREKCGRKIKASLVGTTRYCYLHRKKLSTCCYVVDVCHMLLQEKNRLCLNCYTNDDLRGNIKYEHCGRKCSRLTHVKCNEHIETKFLRQMQTNTNSNFDTLCDDAVLFVLSYVPILDMMNNVRKTSKYMHSMYLSAKESAYCSACAYKYPNKIIRPLINKLDVLKNEFVRIIQCALKMNTISSKNISSKNISQKIDNVLDVYACVCQFMPFLLCTKSAKWKKFYTISIMRIDVAAPEYSDTLIEQCEHQGIYITHIFRYYKQRLEAMDAKD